MVPSYPGWTLNKNIRHFVRCNLRETEIVPENRPILPPKRKFHVPTCNFQGQRLSFKEGMIFELIINEIVHPSTAGNFNWWATNHLPCRIGGFGTWKIRCAAGIHAVVPAGRTKMPRRSVGSAPPASFRDYNQKTCQTCNFQLITISNNSLLIKKIYIEERTMN